MFVCENKNKNNQFIHSLFPTSTDWPSLLLHKIHLKYGYIPQKFSGHKCPVLKY